MNSQFATHALRCRRQGGFNLIEAAIVLGVVGLIIGSIWVAAAAVGEKNRQKQAFAGFSQMIEWQHNTIRKFANNYPNGHSDWTLAAQFIISNPTDGFSVQAGNAAGPWRNSFVTMQLWRPFTVTQLFIWFENMSVEGCIYLLRNIGLIQPSRYGVQFIGPMTAAAIEDGLSSSEIASISSDCADGRTQAVVSY
jgi:hypothetical protein